MHLLFFLYMTITNDIPPYILYSSKCRKTAQVEINLCQAAHFLAVKGILGIEGKKFLFPLLDYCVLTS